MSLVGPRPFLPEQLDDYGNAFDYYVQVRPGMTGLWQINGRNLASFMDRSEWDRYYVRHWSLLLDVHILIGTIGTVLRGTGAY
jgi:lipopolysaccharide/colanic/teichoic acid biosynthesis glycosyltransferase